MLAPKLVLSKQIMTIDMCGSWNNTMFELQKHYDNFLKKIYALQKLITWTKAFKEKLILCKRILFL